MGKNKKVLIADDSSYHRFRLKKLLQENGYEVYEAEDGVDSVQLFRKARPALVITDINMPIMDGIESIQYLKRVDEDVKVIVCSSLEEESMVMKALKAGAKDYVVKPVKTESFLKVVKKYLAE